MKLASRLIVFALPLVALGGCNVPADNSAAKSAQSLAQQACDREDVQDVVGKEVKSILYQGWFEHAGLAVLLIDPREIGEQFKQAHASFHDVAAEAGTDASTSVTRVVCHGILQIDDSSELRGQSILQLRKLRWSIDFGQAVENPQTSAFSILLDRGSLAQDVRVNGEPIEAVQRRSDEEATHSTPPASAAQARVESDAQTETARNAAADADARPR